MRKVLKVFLVAQFIGLICLINQVTTFAKGAGSSSGITLLQPVSAKVAGRGEAWTALSGEALSIHYNPAGLSSLEKQELSIMYQKGLDKDNFATLIYGRRFSFATLGASILYYDTGKIELYDSSGNSISKVGQRDVIFTMGIAREVSKFPIGVNLKFISSEIFGEKASAFAADFGGQYRGLIKNLDIGLSFQNLGTKLTYISKGESLPLTIRLGSSYQKNFTNNSFLLSCDFPYYVNEEEILFLFGVEYIYKKLLSFRGGYRLNLTDTSREDEPINLGIGLAWENYSLDYAIGITKNLSIPHRISLGMKF